MSLFDREIMGRTALGEARGERDIGMQAVMWSGMNRFTMKRWYSGKTIAGTFLKAEQYDCWMTHDPNYRVIIDMTPDDAKLLMVLTWADGVMKGTLPDPTLGATHYANLAACNPKWVADATQTVIIGRHTFFKNVA